LSGFAQRLTRPTRLWIVLLFIAVPVLAFPEIIFGNQTLYLTDLSWIHYPRHIFAAREWLAGRVPLWDPYQHNGLPFLAEAQVGALYLFSVLFLSPLSPSLELSLFIVLHFTLAAIFTFALARLLGMSRAAAAVAGLAFGCGGFLMAQVPNLNIMTGAVWLPLILYGVIQTTRQRSWPAALLAGIPLAFQIFTAQPQIVFYTLVTVGSYGLYRIVADFFFSSNTARGSVAFALRTALLLGVAIISGLLLAAPQLLPTLELQQLSVRSQERTLSFLTENSLPPVMLLNLLLPGVFGNNVTGFKGGDPFQDFIYIGFIPLLLLFFCWRQFRQRDALFFLLLLAGGTVMALGRETPIYQLAIQYLPGFSLFRIPARWLMVVNLALAILAGFGLDTLRQRGLSKRALAAVLAFGLLVLVGLGLIWLFSDSLQRYSATWDDFYQKLLLAFLRTGYSANPIYQDRLLLGRLFSLMGPAFLLVANIIIAGAIFTLFAVRKISVSAFSLLVVLALSIDLAAAGGATINPTQPNERWHQLSGGAQYVLKNLETGRVFPLGMGSEELAVSHLGHYFPSVYRVRSAGGHGSSLMLQRTATFLDEAHPVQAIRVLGVRYLLTQGQMGADAAATYPIVYRNENSFVYENQEPLPRAFVVHRAIQVDTPAAALAHFETANLNPRHTVVLESDESLPSPALPAEGRSTATIVNETPQQLEISVTAAADGYLVLLDTFYPGWEARIGGQPAPIYRANYVSRAVFVPAGQHQIELVYRPLSFRVGRGLALLALLGIAVTAWVDTQKQLVRRAK